MVYEEHPEWKKLLKEKKYKEATEALMREIGINLMRVHNLYSDNKVDVYSEYKVAFGYSYGKNKDRRFEKKLNDFSIFSTHLMIYNIGFDEINSEDEKNECKSIVVKLLKDKKEIKKLMKNI